MKVLLTSTYEYFTSTSHLKLIFYNSVTILLYLFKAEELKLKNKDFVKIPG